MVDVRLSVAVTYSPRRPEFLPGLLARLNQDTVVVCDDQQAGVWPTTKKAWLTYSRDATHMLVLQDDTLPCLDFIAAVRNAVQARPTDPLSFYCNRKIIEVAREQSSSWAKLSHPLSGVANCFPVSLVEQFLLWEASHVDPSLSHDDSRVAMFLLTHQMCLYTSVPSLVEHLGAAHSLLGIPSQVGKYIRQARWYIGADQSGLTVDWQKGLDNPPWDKNGSLAAYQPYLKKEVPSD